MRTRISLFVLFALTLICGDLAAAPARKAAVRRGTRTAVRRNYAAKNARDNARRAIVLDPWEHHHYYWYDDDDYCDDYVRNATCILKVRKVLSDSSGIFQVKCSVGYVSVDRSNLKSGVDYALREKQQIRVDGIDMRGRHSGDTVYLPSSKNLWYTGEYRDAHGKNYLCYSLNEEDAVASAVKDSK